MLSFYTLYLLNLSAEYNQLSSIERHELDAGEMKWLRSMCGLTRICRWRNEEVSRWRIAGAREKMNDRADRKVLMWFGHAERVGGCG